MISLLKLLAIPAIALALSSCAQPSCTFSASGGQPVALFNDLSSFSSSADFVDLRKDPTYRLIEHKAGTADLRSVERFTVSRDMWGHAGKFEYVFYAGRLAETRFHPGDSESFFKDAEKKGFPSAVGVEDVSGNLTIWATGRGSQPDTFGASDSRLVKAFLACVAEKD